MASETCEHDWTPIVGGEVCYGCNRIRRYDSVTYTAPEPLPFTPPTPDRAAVRAALLAMIAASRPAHHYRLAEALGLVSPDEFGVLKWGDTADALLAAVSRPAEADELARLRGENFDLREELAEVAELCRQAEEQVLRMAERAGAMTAPRPETGEPSEAMVEAGAVIVYAAMQSVSREGQQKPWIEGGNSLAQQEARRACRAILRAARVEHYRHHRPTPTRDPK